MPGYDSYGEVVANSMCSDFYGQQELPVHQRADAVSSLVYEANTRMRDPVCECVGAISYLQNQVSQLQMQLAVAQTEILCIQMQPDSSNMATPAHQNNFEADDKSFLFHNNLSQHQYLNYASSSDHHHVIQDSLQRESFFGHDMVS